MRVVLLSFIVVVAFAGESVILTPGVVGNTERAALRNYVGPFRVEGRLHGCVSPGKTAAILTIGPYQFRWLASKPGLLEATLWGDTADAPAQVNVSALHDFFFRAQRDTETRKTHLEVWNAETGERLADTENLRVPGPWNPDGKIELGSPDVACGVVFLRAYKSLLPLNSAPPGNGSTETAVFDLRVNGEKASFHKANAASLTSRPTLKFTGSPQWEVTPSYAPVCDAGTTTTFRAGDTMILDGSRSISTDEMPLKYSWKAIRYPETAALHWSSDAVAKPVLTGTVFGTYVFSLTVENNQGQATCSVTHGAVAMDSQGVVITGDPGKDLLLGPMIAWGRSPWPYLDTQQRVLADAEIARQGTTYNPNTWLVANGSGTVELRDDNAKEKLKIYGTGTRFQEDFCGGGTTPAGARFIVVQYPDPETGEMLYVPGQISTCDSDTQITLVGGYEWGYPDASGLQYSTKFTNYGIWGAGVANANFYDSVLAFYNLYYRSGLDKYRDAARWLADHWVTFPSWNRGYNAAYNMFPRNQAATGMILRMWDGDENHRERWMRYMNRFWTRSARQASVVQSVSYCCDREDGYRLAYTAHGMLFSDSPAVQTRARDGVVAYLTKKDGLLSKRGGNRGLAGDTNNDVWWTYMPPARGTVAVTAGSSLVTISGSTFSSSIPATPSSRWIFWSCENPCESNAMGDPQVYGPVSRISNTEIDIGRPYEASTASGRVAWIFNRNTSVGSIPGWFWQPYMQGIIGVGLNFAQLGLEATAPGETHCPFEGRSVPCENALREMATALISRLVEQGFDTSRYGVWYSRGSALCEPDPAGQGVLCDQGVNSNRTQVPETARAFVNEWLKDQNKDLRDFFDMQFAKAFGKTGGPLGESKNYALDFENLQTPKWFGFGYGYGFASSWPAARILSSWPMKTRTQSISVPVDVSSIPAGAKVYVSVRDPNGKLVSGVPFVCQTSPCTTEIEDAHMGDHLIKVDYRDSAGSMHPVQDWRVLRVRDSITRTR